MNRLRDYKNLRHLYRRSRNIFMLLFFLLLVIALMAIPVSVFVEGFPFELAMLMLMMIFPSIMFGVFWLVASIRTKKQLKMFTPQQLATIDNEILRNPSCEGLTVTGWAVVSSKLGLQMVPMGNVLWVYLYVTVGKLEGLIPVYKTTSLYIAGRDGRKRAFHIKNNKKAFDFICAELLKYRKDIVFGYERGLDDIYKNDRNRMIQFAQECAEQRQQEMQSAQNIQNM